MIKATTIIQGGKHEDARGRLTFFNGFDMGAVKRFYVIEHPDTEAVRAWQGHQREQKWFYVIEGAFKLVLVQPNNWIDPSDGLQTEEFTLQTERNEILHVPGGFANGFKALIPKSRIMVFSSFTVEESGNDNFRYDKNLWYNWKGIFEK